MPVELQKDRGLCVIHLDGEINITSATALKEALLRALESGTELRADLERATELDITALQLLWAAEREARGAGKVFTVLGAVPDRILQATAEAGLEKFPLVEVPSSQR